MQAEYQESIERTHMWDTEFRVTWPDGSVHWLLAKGQVFLDDAGRPVRLAGIISSRTPAGAIAPLPGKIGRAAGSANL